MEQLKRKRTQLKKANVNYNDVKVRIDELENVFFKYKDIQDEIDGLCDKDSDIQREDTYRNDIEDMYFAAKSIFSSLSQENLDNTVIEGAGCKYCTTE